MKVTTMSYGQFLVNSPANFTGTYFADTVDGLEHDSVFRFLKDSRLTPALLREKMEPLIAYSPHGRVLFADSVMDTSASRKIEGAVKQYSGNAHHVVTGIGVVTCVYYNPDTLTRLPYRRQAAGWQNQARPCDRHACSACQESGAVLPCTHGQLVCYRSELMNKIMDWNKYFVCAVKSNRLFSPDKGCDDRDGIHRSKAYEGVKDMPWGEEAQKTG